MKKFISILLALMLVMSLGTVAFADGETTLPEDVKTFTITKSYTLVGDAATAKSPAETFAFTVVCGTTENLGEGADAENIPLPTITSAVYDTVGAAGSANKEAYITVSLPDYKAVGIYNYTINETAGSTAGVTYRTTPITLKVTVINGANDGEFIRQVAVHAETPVGEKSSTFEDNTYSAGKLDVSKEVVGNFGDKKADYTITVKFKAPDGLTVKSDITCSGYGVGEKNAAVISAGENGWTGEKSVDILLKHDAHVVFENIPYGVTYEVSEVAPEGYEEAKITYSDTAKKVDTDRDNVKVTNQKLNDTAIETGISLDSLPYILMLVVVGAAIVVVSTRKKGEQF